MEKTEKSRLDPALRKRIQELIALQGGGANPDLVEDIIGNALKFTPPGGRITLGMVVAVVLVVAPIGLGVGCIAGYIGASARFDQAIAQFAADYATQTERDWQALLHSRHHAAPSSAKKPATIKSTTKNPTPKSPQPRACAPSPRRS